MHTQKILLNDSRGDSDSPRASTSAETSGNLSAGTCQVLVENDINISRIVLPDYVYKYQNPFLRKVEQHFHNALFYNNKGLQKRAKSFIPEELLSFRALKRTRWLQQQIKQGSVEDPNVMFKDFLLLELTLWFKNDFFTWVDSPECETCSQKTKFSHMAENLNDYPYANRVELHKCLNSNCNRLTPFPRYNDLNILMETRKGRCGEWANTFCLFCRALDWDARFVVEESDHVWVEVYSPTERRWIHCDPCEGICDKPLMYETGWGKKISYVIAYSSEEVQDVTWRYTSRFKEVLSRRTKCSESELIECLMRLRAERQTALNISGPRKKFLTRRIVTELYELLEEKQPNREDVQGRISGALDWRVSRGETQPITSYIWQIERQYIVDNQVTFRYSPSSDRYEFLTKENPKSQEKWNSGVFHSLNMFRKLELDWKQVYLSRTEGSNKGELSWKFQLVRGIQYEIEGIDLYMEYTTFENGLVEIDVTPDAEDVTTIASGEFTRIRFPHPSDEVTITATLTGGKGDTAWQHAQLFRQAIDSQNFPFVVVFKLREWSLVE